MNSPSLEYDRGMSLTNWRVCACLTQLEFLVPLLGLAALMPSHFHVYPVTAGGETMRVTFPLPVSSSCSSHRVSEQCSTLTLQAVKIQYQFQVLQCWYWQC